MSAPRSIEARSRAAAGELAAGCLAMRVRLLSRKLTRVYDAALRPLGLTVGQLGILTVLVEAGPCSPRTIGSVLEIEKSTLSRNLKRMGQHGWVAIESAGGERARRVSITGAGRRLLVGAHPHWREAQREAQALLGADHSEVLRAAATPAAPRD